MSPSSKVMTGFVAMCGDFVVNAWTFLVRTVALALRESTALAWRKDSRSQWPKKPVPPVMKRLALRRASKGARAWVRMWARSSAGRGLVGMPF